MVQKKFLIGKLVRWKVFIGPQQFGKMRARAQSETMKHMWAQTKANLSRQCVEVYSISLGPPINEE